MAGDWIKMRGNLWDDPRVAKICDITEQPEAMVIGGLYWLWAMADQHTENGCLPGLTVRQIDRKTGIQGFGAALVAVSWLIDREEGVEIVRFEEHNGQSAKRRCVDAQRKANARNVSASDADIVRTDGGQPADEKRRTSELEKRREEKSKHKQPSVAVRAARLPADWEPGPEGIAFAGKLGFANGALAAELDKFRDFWAAKAGKDATKADWPATWRTWLRRASEQRAPPRKGDALMAGNIAAAQRFLEMTDD